MGAAGPGAIPFSSIVRWAELHNVDDIDYLVQVIRAMDQVYFEHTRQHRERGRRG